MSRSAAIACLLSLGLLACRRPGPDENYQKAAAIYGPLYASELDDAYGDPRMDEVVALLKKVDRRSADAHAAEVMLSAIEHGRAALAKERAEREKFAAAAAAAVPTSSNIDPQQVLAASTPPAAAQDPYGPGATIAELNAQTGGCLVDNEPFTENGTGVSGTVYRVAATETCRGKVPGMVGQMVLVSGGKIYRRTADVRPLEPVQPVAPPPRPAAPKPRAAAPAPPSEPQYQIYVPGGPMPGAAPPQQQQ